MSPTIKPSPAVKGGDWCEVVGGTHAGKTGHVTITVVQKSGERFKTLARNVARERSARA
ncbi:MAG TPA: hypothetical protein VN645_14140 [Steroidobacteraceae bacterium]|nr:hypothetical protein [Steroidobacteraceae bacterium]